MRGERSPLGRWAVALAMLGIVTGVVFLGADDLTATTTLGTAFLLSWSAGGLLLALAAVIWSPAARTAACAAAGLAVVTLGLGIVLALTGQPESDTPLLLSVSLILGLVGLRPYARSPKHWRHVPDPRLAHRSALRAARDDPADASDRLGIDRAGSLRP